MIRRTNGDKGGQGRRWRLDISALQANPAFTSKNSANRSPESIAPEKEEQLSPPVVRSSPTSTFEVISFSFSSDAQENGSGDPPKIINPQLAIGSPDQDSSKNDSRTPLKGNARRVPGRRNAALLAADSGMTDANKAEYHMPSKMIQNFHGGSFNQHDPIIKNAASRSFGNSPQSSASRASNARGFLKIKTAVVPSLDQPPEEPQPINVTAVVIGRRSASPFRFASPAPAGSGQLCYHHEQGRCTAGDMCKNIHNTVAPCVAALAAQGDDDKRLAASQLAAQIIRRLAFMETLPPYFRCSACFKHLDLMEAKGVDGIHMRALKVSARCMEGEGRGSLCVCVGGGGGLRLSLSPLSLSSTLAPRAAYTLIIIYSLAFL